MPRLSLSRITRDLELGFRETDDRAAHNVTVVTASELQRRGN